MLICLVQKGLLQINMKNLNVSEEKWAKDTNK